MKQIIKEDKIARLYATSPDVIITILFYYLGRFFTSDSKKIHTKINELREKQEYRDLLKPFEFVNAPRFHYSPLLERVLDRLQITHLIEARNPECGQYEMDEIARAKIEYNILNKKFSGKQHEKLKRIKKMAEELKPALKA